MMFPVTTCSRCRTVVETGDLRCPVCYLAVPPATVEASTRVRARILRCDGCAAAMEYRAGLQALHCAFCGGTVKPEEQIDPVEQTERHLPFTVDRSQAIEIYRRWISQQSFFRPANLASAAQLESLRALWWVGWAVDAQAEVTWTADSNAGAGRADWAPHAGELQTVFDDVVIPATRGLTEAECARLVPTYSLGSGAPAPGDPGGEVVQERFEIPRSSARTRIVGALRNLAESRVRSGQVPGGRFRNFHAAIHLRGLVTRRLAFPAYVLAYRYRGAVYRTVVSGQDPNCVIGEAPRSLARLVVVLLLALGLVALLAGLILLLR